jgi:hypothetical protein
LLFRGTENACLCQISRIIGGDSLHAPGKLNKAQAPGIKVRNFGPCYKYSQQEKVNSGTGVPKPSGRRIDVTRPSLHVTTTRVTEIRITLVTAWRSSRDSRMSLNRRGSRWRHPIIYRRVDAHKRNECQFLTSKQKRTRNWI